MATDVVGIPTAPERRGPTLTQRASLNAIASLLDYAAKLVVGFVVTPIVVAGLGRSLFGTWEMQNRLVTYMSAADGRPTEAIRLMVANRQAVDDATTQRRYVGAALAVWLLFLPVITAAGGLVIWLAPGVTKAAPDLHGTVRVATALLLASFFMTLVAGVPESVLRGMNLGYRRMGLQASLNLVGGLLMIAAVRAGLGLVGLGGTQVVLTFVTGLVFWSLARRYVPWFGVARPTRQDVRALLAMSAWLTVGEVVVKLLLASDVLILGMVLSPAVVATYALTGYAARSAIGIHEFTASAAMPGLGGLIGRGDHTRAAQVRRELQTLTWLLVTGIGATILAWNPSFLSLWVGRQHYAGPWVDLLIVVIAVQTAFIRTDAYIIDAALRPRPRVLVGAAAMATTIALAVPLTRALGIAGLCLGLLAGRAVQSVGYPMLVRSCFRQRFRPSLEAARLGIVTVLLFAVSSTIGRQVVAASWPAWGAGLALTLSLAVGIALLLGPSGSTRRAIYVRVRGLWPSRTRIP